MLISRILFLIAAVISDSVLPTPEKTIFLRFIPALSALINSPIETTSAPEPIFLSSLSKAKFEFDLTEKQINGDIFLKELAKLK